MAKKYTDRRGRTSIRLNKSFAEQDREKKTKTLSRDMEAYVRENKLNFSRKDDLRKFLTHYINRVEDNKTFAKNAIDKLQNAGIKGMREAAHRVLNAEKNGDVLVAQRAASIVNKARYDNLTDRNKVRIREKEVMNVLDKFGRGYGKILRAELRGMSDKEKLFILNGVSDAEHGFNGGTPDSGVYEESEAVSNFGEIRERTRAKMDEAETIDEREGYYRVMSILEKLMERGGER